jgi:uncharacterized protein (DUF433 family)
MNEPFLALDANTASKITGISKSQLSDWERRGIVTSSYAHLRSETGSRRAYSYRDILNIRTLSQIRQQLGLPLAEITRAGAYLTTHGKTAWSQLGIGISGKRLVFRNPETHQWADAPEQAILELNLSTLPDEVTRLVSEALQRDPANSGKIERNRNIMHNAPVVAGTRIPTSTIWVYHEDGYSTEEIIEQYPQLTPEDIEAAIAYENGIRSAA